jgi:hypothetical protein
MTDGRQLFLFVVLCGICLIIGWAVKKFFGGDE